MSARPFDFAALAARAKQDDPDTAMFAALARADAAKRGVRIPERFGEPMLGGSEYRAAYEGAATTKPRTLDGLLAKIRWAERDMHKCEAHAVTHSALLDAIAWLTFPPGAVPVSTDYAAGGAFDFRALVANADADQPDAAIFAALERIAYFRSASRLPASVRNVVLAFDEYHAAHAALAEARPRTLTGLLAKMRWAAGTVTGAGLYAVQSAALADAAAWLEPPKPRRARLSRVSRKIGGAA